jgi:hypothetical protein
MNRPATANSIIFDNAQIVVILLVLTQPQMN